MSLDGGSLDKGSPIVVADLPTGEDQQKYVENPTLHTGVRQGLAMTINADTTKFDVASGKAIIIDRDPDPTNPTITEITFAGQTAILDTNLGVALSHIYMDSTGTITVELNTPTLADINDRVHLGAILHVSSVIDSIVPNPIVAHCSSNTEMVELVLGGGTTLSGAIVTANGSNLTLDVSAGLLRQFGRGFGIDANIPNEVETPVQSAIPAGNFFKAHIDSGGGLIATNGTNLLSPTLFNEDGLGTLNTVANNQFTILRLFYAGITNDVIIYFGTEEFMTIAAARTAPELTWVEHAGTIDVSPIARIIIREDVTDIAAGITAGTVEIIAIQSRMQL